MLYKLHSHRLKPGVVADPNRFKHVFDSKYGKVRIFKVLNVSQESKKFVADPANRICDVEGGWYCRGQYPPGLADVLSKAKTFSQQEDFNKKRNSAKDTDEEEYIKKYYDNMADPQKAKQEARKKDAQKEAQKQDATLGTDTTHRTEKQPWEDTETTIMLYYLISQDKMEQLSALLKAVPDMAHVRAANGRGPMWWAFEFQNEVAVQVLMKYGVSTVEKDVDGKSPVEPGETPKFLIRAPKEAEKLTLQYQDAALRTDTTHRTGKQPWEDTETTTMLYELISQNKMVELWELLKTKPEMAHLRAANGRGPMWWAFEFQNEVAAKVLMKYGVSTEEKDVDGKSAMDISKTPRFIIHTPS